MKSALQHPFQPRIDPRPDMEKALDKAIEMSTGTKCYSITDGRLVHEQQHRYRYTFVLESPWDLADGTAFQLKSSDFDHLPIELSNTKGEVITITTTQRLPEHTLTAAHLIIERAYLLRKMKEALTRVSTPADLDLKLFGYQDCPDETAASSLVDLISDVFVPDDAQRALASDVQMILGPGGMGKTDVLAAIAMQHVLLYKHRVLICSHTNIAIDNAVIRLATFFRKHGQDEFLDEQNLIRYGRPHLSLLETDDYRHVTMSLIVNDAIEQQHEEIACLKDRHTALLQQITMAEEELPGQIRAWEQRQEAISVQRVQLTWTQRYLHRYARCHSSSER